jgi:hypothetical protein
MSNGIDFAWHPAIDYGDVRRQGYTFVCRYLSHTDGKNLHPDEARGWLAAGLSIVLVWESTADRALDGRDAGVQDAKAALAQANACGAPPTAAIYFAVDIDTTVTPAIADYFRGAASVLGVSRVGVYGSYRVVNGCLNAAVARYGWQTYAWSHGRWDARARLRQVRNGVKISGISADLDTATGEIGAWTPAVPTPPSGHDRFLRLTDPPMRDLPGHHDVTDVQNALNKAGNSINVTGIYDPDTALAINTLAAEHGFPPGVGPQMWTLLRQIAHPTPAGAHP